ncbi:MAG: alpha-amylase family glycosyl hydrolase, partial [Cyanobacteria bacterium J06649_4]
SIPEPRTTDDGVWPKEFQNIDFYTRAGSIGQWETAAWEDAQSSQVEFRRGDFFDLKDFNLDNDEAMRALTHSYQYWIALTDCDGFRMDAVKHVSAEHSQKFCRDIRDYAQSIGKDNFFLTGEITAGDLASAYIDLLGNNIDTLLSIVKYPNALTAFAKGLSHPNDFLSMYDPGHMEGLVRQAGRYLVNVLDDHDMSSRGAKARFAAGSGDVPHRYQQVAHVVGVQLTTPGIPAIYYGTEQAFDGSEAYHDYAVEPNRFGEDRYIRESMFGGEFGAFGTQGCHFFNQQHPTYVRISAIARLRNRQDAIGMALRRGRFFPRETTFLDYGFEIHGPGEITAWSRLFLETEVLVVLNPHGLETRAAAITVDARLHPAGSTLRYLYRGDWSDAMLENSPEDKIVTVQVREGRSVVEIELPPSGMALLV